MLSDELVVQLNDVWKRYSKETVLYRSMREDMMSFLGRRKNSELAMAEFWALKGVSLKIRQGEIVGLLGPNGAGKTTLLKLIAGVTKCTRGNISVNGRVAPLFAAGAGFHPDLTGRENIFMNGTILGMSIQEVKDKMETIIDFSQVREFIDMQVKKYSSGMFIKLAFSIAIHSEADIYLLDEFVSVLDVSFRETCIAKIVELKNNAKTIIITSQDEELVKSLSSRIFTLNKGGLV